VSADEDIDALLSAMRRQARAETDQLLSDAQAQAREIHARADADIEAMEARALAEVEGQLAIEADRTLGTERMNRRQESLAVKRRLLREAFDRAGQAIRALQDPAACRRVLAELIAEALASVGPGARVTVAQSQADLCRQIVAEQGLDCTVQPGGGPEGTVIAASADGTRQVDNSLATRLARAEALTAGEVLAVLAGRQGAGARSP